MLKNILRAPPVVYYFRTAIQSAQTSANHRESEIKNVRFSPRPSSSLSVNERPARFKNYRHNQRADDQTPNKKNINVFRITNTGNNRTSIFRGVPDTPNESKKFSFGGKSAELADELNDEDPQRLMEYERELDTYARDENAYHEGIVNEDIAKRKRIKMGIIKKRAAKIENEVKHVNTNLLTWDAKEQIKYLNLTFPDEWTVSRIVESFPITEDSCRKLLKSKWAPKTLEDLIKHDNRAMENWKLMCKNDQSDYDGPAINIYEEYKSLNKLNLMKHAMGIPGVEFKRSKVFSDTYSLHENLLVKPGKFSSLIKRDTKVMQLLNKKSDREVRALSVDTDTSKHSLKEHLGAAKDQLNASLVKLFSEKPQTSPKPQTRNIYKKNSNNDVY